MQRTFLHNSTSSLNSFKSIISSSSDSSCGTAKICRICHVVESSTKKSNNKLQSQQIQHRPINSGKTGKDRNFIQWILSLKPEFDDDIDDELIAPCECRGTMRYVHRECLNQWRTASPRSDSFTRCEQCFASYNFRNTWMTSILVNPVTIYSISALLFASWIVASTFVSTGALYKNEFDSTSSDLFTLLPTIYFNSKTKNPILNIFPIDFIFKYNDFMEYFNTIFYGLVFISLTEYIFFTPSFILSFNTLFCIWRIQRYELFFDKWLLVAFTVFGLWRAAKSLHGMIESATTRIVKLKLLEVIDNDKEFE